MITFTAAQKLKRNAIAEELKRRQPARDYADCVREAVLIVQGTGKAKGGSRKAARKAPRGAGSEAATVRAVAKAVREALTASDLTPPMTQAPTAPAGADPFTQLHTLSHDSGEELLGGVFASPEYSQQMGLRSPFWQGIR